LNQIIELFVGGDSITTTGLLNLNLALKDMSLQLEIKNLTVTGITSFSKLNIIEFNYINN